MLCLIPLKLQMNGNQLSVVSIHTCAHTHIDVLTVLNGHFITQSKDLKSYLIITKPIQH